MAEKEPNYEILGKSLNKRLFEVEPDADRDIKLAVIEAQRLGAFTVADVVTLGMGYFYASTTRSRFNVERADTLFTGIEALTGSKMSWDKQDPQNWPRLYPRLEAASPAILLPAQGEAYNYHSYTDMNIIRRTSVTIGDMLHRHFVESYGTDIRQIVYSNATSRIIPTERYKDRLEQAAAAVRGMEQFIEREVVPAVANFNDATGNPPAQTP